MPLVSLGGARRESDYPLLQARVHYDLVDVYLSARLTQTYTSKASVPTEVKYVFPLPPDASVYAFEAIIDRTRTIKGVVKGKEQAKAEYDRAKRQGRTAALLDQKTEEVFEMSLGNIPPKSVVDVRISFLSLVEQDGPMDTIRLTFPTTIAPHYGTAPTHLPTETPHAVELTLGITASAPIQSLSSVSHPIETIMGRTTEREEETFDPKLAHIKFTSQRFLKTDIVVVMRCRVLDRPRCTVEPFLPEGGAEELTDAYALTFVPRFESSPILSQEYIFLVDRSGSMDDKMVAVRSALRIMLASLPASGTTLNIISFGTSHRSIWPSSVNYDTDTVNKALRHVDRMDASYGGTEMASAIEGASRLRKIESGRPTAVFLLTDGEAWDLDGVSATVRRIVDAGEEAKSPIRFFCMGIGNAPSKALVDVIARAGNGVSLFVREDEGASSKLVTLLRAARSVPVENLAIDWGVSNSPSPTETPGDDDFEVIPPNNEDTGPGLTPLQPATLYDESITSNNPPHSEELGPRARKPVELPPPPRIQQAPSLSTLPPLYPGFRYSVFAIIRRDIQSEGVSDQRRSVTVTGTSQGTPVSLEIPLQFHASTSEPHATAKFLHVIAARALIRSFEDRVPMSGTDKAEVLRLAVRYGLSSSQTAFVAVEEGDSTPQISQIADDPSADNAERGRTRSRSGTISSIPSLAESCSRSPSTSGPVIMAPRSRFLRASSSSSGRGQSRSRSLSSDEDCGFGLFSSGPHSPAYSPRSPPRSPSPIGSVDYSFTSPPRFHSRSSRSRSPRSHSPIVQSAPTAPGAVLASACSSVSPPASGSQPQGQKHSRFFRPPRPATGALLDRASTSSSSLASEDSMLSSVVELEPSTAEGANDDAPGSVASLACLQLPNGAFSPSDNVYALVGGPDTKDLLGPIIAQYLLVSSTHNPSLASANSPAPESTNSAKQEGDLQSSVNSEDTRRSISSEDITPLRPSAQFIAETLWTTFLVLAFMDGKLADSREEWILMLEKARTWITSALEQLQAECTASSEAVAAFSQALETEAQRAVAKL